MRGIFIGIIVFMVMGSVCFSQEPTPSEVKEVTLFSDQALVKRQASLSVNQGLNEILLEVKAFNLDRDSVQAKVFGEGEVFSVQLKDIYLKEAPQENIKILKEKIKNLEQTKRGLHDQTAVLFQKEKFLGSIVEFSNIQVPEEIKTEFPSTEDLTDTLNFLGESYAKTYKARQELEIKIVEIDKDIDVLKKELASLKRPTDETKKVIEVLFNSKRQQQIQVEASYVAYNAYWRPFYKVDVSQDLKDINIVMFSKIMQKTGEEWEKIKLFISNVIPLRGVGLPSLSSWILDIQKRWKDRADKNRMRLSSMKLAKTEIFVDGLGGEAEEEATIAEAQVLAPTEAEFSYAAAKELPLSFEYEISQPLDIPSQDKETILPLLSKDLEGEFFYYSVPKRSSLVFLVCRASSDKELLSAPLNVYFADRYIGKTYLSEKRPGEDFDVSLGADREVKVKRETLKDKIKETAFFGKIERQTIIRGLRYKITVENIKDKAIKMKVLDNVPVSKTDKIEVKDLKISPEPTTKDYQDKEGLMLWEFDIRPKDKKEIYIEFVVTYPKDAPVVGI